MKDCASKTTNPFSQPAYDFVYIYRSGGRYYNNFAAAARAYLNDRWKGERPTLIARDNHRDELWRWEPQYASSDLPF